MDKREPHHARQINEISLHANRMLLQVFPVQTRDKLLMFIVQFAPRLYRFLSNVECTERPSLHNLGTMGAGA